jgi:hypothetical protein
MMKINPEETNIIEFDVNIRGTSLTTLKGYFRLTIDSVEYGFPADITISTIKVTIPLLSGIVKKVLSDREEISARLEIAGAGHHFVPWEGVVEIESPITIEAKVKNESAVPSIKITNVKDAKIEELKHPIEEIKPTVVDITEKDLTGEIDEESTERIMRKVLKEDEISESNSSTSESSTLSGALMRKLGI